MNDQEIAHLTLKQQVRELYRANKGHDDLMHAVPHADHRHRVTEAADRVRMAIAVLLQEGAKFETEGLP